MNENRQTIEAYEGHVQEYIDGTYQGVDGDMKIWMDTIAENVQPDSRILEIGSAFGRDAVYLQGMGFTVECTDGTQAFVDYLQEHGFAARKLDLIADPIEGQYDLVMANAVLLHFTPEQTREALRKVRSALTDNGLFAFTLKEGDGEEWSEAKLGTPRYFHYWRSDDIEAVIREAGYSDMTILKGATHNAEWLQILARK